MLRHIYIYILSIRQCGIDIRCYFDGSHQQIFWNALCPSLLTCHIWKVWAYYIHMFHLFVNYLKPCYVVLIINVLSPWCISLLLYINTQNKVLPTPRYFHEEFINKYIVNKNNLIIYTTLFEIWIIPLSYNVTSYMLMSQNIKYAAYKRFIFLMDHVHTNIKLNDGLETKSWFYIYRK